MSNEIQVLKQNGDLIAPRYSFADLEAMAKNVAASGMFKMTAPQVLTLMMLAESEGMHPMKAMMRYHVFEGRPTMRSDAMQAEFLKDGGRIEWVKDTDLECEAIFYHEKHCPKGHAVSYTMKDAQNAGLAQKAVWKNHPRSMMRARVITNGVRMIDPGVIMGIYAPEEIEEYVLSQPEQSARATLDAKLRERIQDRHPPVAETVKAVEEAQKPQDEPRSDCRTWVEDSLKAVNDAILAADPNAKAVHANVVVNHVIKESIIFGTTKEAELLREDGKRDSRKVADEINRLWVDQNQWVREVAQEYMVGLVPEVASA